MPGIEELRKNDMMAHLIDSLESGKDIGHYGRLVFVMVARYFLSEDEIVRLLKNDPDFSEEDARSLYKQVVSRGYNPPKRERVLEWQDQQDFPICPNPEDPGSCNVYKDLNFPEEVYEQINEYYDQKTES
ncbi:hypothetical protein Tter_0215 [Thermobaculum terrenum ATCC BAA-798]|uniref:Uncharacterized protein n=1 Tax=Thermobaculum terrenum (strain ATCC BAA-798 / CCMEE 7001 / YNP1) TaxID=525904 RepID=D1CDY1_THET1|nr:hypothetical protein [Thermobaculum terrenum]ACZ41137.1 hypothetical protein Tter_0215 [Thermobaculum terrenum ATCC BAA-798]